MTASRGALTGLLLVLSGALQAGPMCRAQQAAAPPPPPPPQQADPQQPHVEPPTSAKAAALAARLSGTPTIVTPALMAARRDLWPQRVALLVDEAFEEGESLPAGTEVWLQDVDDAGVHVDTGTFTFQCPLEETDALLRAQVLVDALTPEQLALDWAGLRARTDLWPLRVVLNTQVELADDTIFPAGRELAVRELLAAGPSVADRAENTFFTVDPWQTDVFARARTLLVQPAAQRAPFFLRSLQAAIAPREGVGGGAHTLADAELVLVFCGRLGSTPCTAFAAELRAFLKRVPADAPRLAVVLLGKDRSAEDQRAWVAEMAVPGEVVAWDRRLEAATLATFPVDRFPGLFVLDRDGTLLERDHADGDTPTAQEVLAHLAQRLHVGPPDK